ncbi:MAG: HAD family hydrolase [Treponemataceae bacterium]
MYDAMIFDLDGVLLDSMEMWGSIGEKYLQWIGIEPESIPANLPQALLTMGLKESAHYLKKTLNLSPDENEILEGVNSVVENEYAYNLQLKEGVLPFLERTAEVKKCIVTETPKALVELALHRLKIMHHFDFILAATEFGKGKKHPDIFIYAVQKIQASASKIIIFEDAPYAMESAKKAGLVVCAVKEKTYEDKTDEIKKLADFFIDSLADWK